MAAMAAFLSGCGGIGTGTTTLAIRVVDAVASRNTQADFVISGSTFITQMAFTGVTTYGYINIGNNTFLANITQTSTPLVPTQTLDLTQSVYTVAATGVPGSSTTPPMFVAFPDDNAAPARSRIRVRVINLSPDAGPVDTTLGGLVAATATGYRAASPYASLSAGTYDLAIHPAGSSIVLATKSAQALAAAHVFTIFIEGLVADGSLVIVPQEDV
jgi:hypothetical protein